MTLQPMKRSVPKRLKAMGSFIPATQEERHEMLQAAGYGSVREMYAAVPDEVWLEHVNLPAGKTEMEVAEDMGALAEKNTQFKSCFRGAGAYRHFIPAAVRAITSKEEFVTAYTPYQAEISQGVLQSIFEYQTQICELTGMDVSNASVYDGATAAAEAVCMCEERKRTGVVVSAGVNPQTLEVVRTYCEAREISVNVVPLESGATTPAAVAAALEAAGNAASVLFQSPNYFGVIEDAAALVETAHAAKAKAIFATNPIALGILKTPGEVGADVAVGEGQPLGMPLSFGGPYLGYMAATQKMMRSLPGRIVGQTVDADGTRCYVLTLQAREQHIRREKASSNICSNEALCAMTASVYLATMGPAGLAQAAKNSAAHAHYLQKQLSDLGFELQTKGEFFHEFLTSTPVDAGKLEAALAAKGILSGLPVESNTPAENGILWCCTELTTKDQIDELVSAIKEVL